jgi:hypothetical protein
LRRFAILSHTSFQSPRAFRGECLLLSSACITNSAHIHKKSVVRARECIFLFLHEVVYKHTHLMTCVFAYTITTHALASAVGAAILFLYCCVPGRRFQNAAWCFIISSKTNAYIQEGSLDAIQHKCII